jgi:hypothetical protein
VRRRFQALATAGHGVHARRAICRNDESGGACLGLEDPDFEVTLSMDLLRAHPSEEFAVGARELGGLTSLWRPTLLATPLSRDNTYTVLSPPLS